MSYISKIIKLTTLSPIFIKGKDFDYGEGMLQGSDGNVYLINNDKLCEYIDIKGKTEEYIKYFVRDRMSGYNEIEGFADFLGITLKDNDWNLFRAGNRDWKAIEVKRKGQTIKVDLDKFKNWLKQKEQSLSFNTYGRDDYGRYKNMSLEYFLERYNIKPTDQEIQKMSNGITRLSVKNGFIIDAMKRHYIPGSSIKGAIRNAVLWKIISEQGKKNWLNGFVREKVQQLNTGNLVDKYSRRTSKNKLVDKFSSQFNYQNQTIDSLSFTVDKMAIRGDYASRWRLTDDILRDLFRVIKISDAYFTKEVRAYPQNARAVCISSGGTYQKTFPIELHCLSEQLIAKFKITIDQGMAKSLIGEQLPNYLQSVEGLLGVINEFFQSLWKMESDVFKGKTSIPQDDRPNRKLRADTSLVSKFYSQSQGDYLFRTGWGGGLLTKTQFLNLDEQQRKQVRDIIRTPRPNDMAPKSRCLLVERDKAISSLGWCKLEVTEDKELSTGNIQKEREIKPTSFSELSSSVTNNDNKDKPKSKYKVGEVIRNATFEKKGDSYLVSIKGQEESAKLKGKPNFGASIVNVIVTKIENGIVTEVKIR